MDTEKVYTTSLRLYKSRPVHHQAYRYLKEYNKDIFKTKDDFIAEAIVYFAKYLQQEEEVQQMKLLNTLLENQKEQFCKIVKEAVSKAQEEAFETASFTILQNCSFWFSRRVFNSFICCTSSSCCRYFAK